MAGVEEGKGGKSYRVYTYRRDEKRKKGKKEAGSLSEHGKCTL